MEWRLVVRMPDGSEWAYSVMDIARNRAEHYADEYGGDVERRPVRSVLVVMGWPAVARARARQWNVEARRNAGA